MTVEPTPNDSRIAGLDALRGLAALSVVLFHYTTRYDNVFGHSSAPLFEAAWGHYGVQLFFGISGFVIFMTLDRTRSLTDFAISRASRLYPAYWVAIVLTTAVIWLTDLQGFSRSGAEIAFNLTMLQNFVGVAPVDGVYWTLSVELAFYFAMAALWRLGLLVRIELVLLAWMSLKWLWTYAPLVAGFEFSWLLGALLVQDHIPFFAIGIAAYRMKSKGGAWPIGVVAAALATIVGCAGLEQLLVGFISTAFLFSVALARPALLRAAPLVWLGTISYSLYLLHQFIGFAMIRRLEQEGWDATIAISATIGAMFTLAASVTYLVEQPALRSIRSWYRGRSAQDPATRQPLAPAE